MNGQAATMKTTEKSMREFTGRSMLIWLGAFFGVMFTANAFLVWFALTSWTGLEVESSYKAGQAYQQEINAARAQAGRGWNVSAHVERAADGNVRLRIDARDRESGPLSGMPVSATLRRPTHRAEDRVVALVEGEAGVYSGRVAELGAGRWDLLIEIDDDSGPVFRSKNRVFLSE